MDVKTIGPLLRKTPLIEDLLAQPKFAERISAVREEIDQLAHHTQQGLVGAGLSAEELGMAITGIRAFQEAVYLFDAKGRADKATRERNSNTD